MHLAFLFVYFFLYCFRVPLRDSSTAFMIKNILISLDQPVINLYFIFTFIVLCFTFAGIQDMLPQNMAPWHIKYFKLKEFEKQQAQARFSELPPKQVLRSSREVPFLYSREKEQPYLGRQRCWKESEWTGLAVSPFTTLSSNPFLPDHIFPWFSTRHHT